MALRKIKLNLLRNLNCLRWRNGTEFSNFKISFNFLAILKPCERFSFANFSLLKRKVESSKNKKCIILFKNNQQKRFMCKCSQENCDLDIYKNSGKCILHSEDKNKNIEEFWKEIRKIVTEKNDEKKILNIYIDFENVFFPEFEKEGLAKTYNGDTFFEYSSPKKFNKEFKLINCIFYEDANFKNIIFEKGLEFDRCIFEKSLNLKNMRFKKSSKVRIKNCPKIVNANFENTIFEDLSDFYNSTFVGKTNFERTTFKDISVFSNVTFRDDIDFRLTTFEKLAQFKETIFEKKLNFEDTIIKEKINFLKTKTVNNENLKPENIENRETARIIKDSFEQQNNIIEANKFYALEMKEREKELKFFKKPFEWLVFKIHGMASNHSQDFLLALFWILNITFVTVFLQFELVCENSFVKLFDRLFFFFGGLILLGYGISKLKENFRNIAILLFSIISYFIYSNTYIDDTSLKLFSNTLNPFSIMTGKEELSFGILLYKIIIAYLIYQLIISIRQNTRRK